MSSTLMTPEKAFEGYRSLVEENEQALPLLVYTNMNDETTVMGLMVEMPEGMGMQDILAQVLQSARAQLGPAKAVVFHSEGWVKSAVTDEEKEALGDTTRPGSFQAEVNAGAELAEAVTITGVSADEAWNLIVPFVRSAPGHVTWDEPVTCQALGGIPDLLREAVLDGMFGR